MKLEIAWTVLTYIVCLYALIVFQAIVFDDCRQVLECIVPSFVY